MHRRDEQGALADGRLRLIALGERAEVGEMRLRHEDLVADLAVKTEAREGFLELLVTHAHAERAEGDVARLRDGLPEVDAAVDFAMALAYRVAAADVEHAVAVKDLRRVRHAVRQRRIGNHRLNGRARRVKPLDGAVEERAVLLPRERLPVRLDVIRVIRGRAHHRKHGSRPRVERDDGAATLAESCGGCLLGGRLDGQLDVIAALRLQELRERAEAAHIGRQAEQRLVGVTLDAGAADVLAVVARDGSHGRAERVDAAAVLARLGQDLAVGREDGAALDVGPSRRTPHVERVLGEVVRLPSRQVDDIDSQQSEQDHRKRCRPEDLPLDFPIRHFSSPLTETGACRAR